MAKHILLLLLLFLAGVAGGLWSQAFLLPSLAANPAFQNWQFIQDWNARTQVIAPVEQVFLRENQATERTIQQVKGSVVAVQSAAGRQGSGLIYTSDGLIVTLASLVPQGYSVAVFQDGEELSAEVLKRDVSNNLALLKIEKTGLQTMRFAEQEGVALGEQVVLVSKILSGKDVSTTVNQGIVKTEPKETFATSFSETSLIAGSPLFTLEQKVAGLAFVDRQGNISAFSSSLLRSFLGL